MRKLIGICILLLGLNSMAHAESIGHKLGLGYAVGPSFLAGGSNAKDIGQTVGPGVGITAEYGLTSFASFEYSYDYLDEGLQAQDMTFSGIVHLAASRPTSPFIGFGMGFGRRYNGDNYNKFSMKIQGGLEHFLTSNIAVSGLLAYHYINGPDPVGSLHMVQPGLRMAYYFF